jgi:phosphopantothenoylcysteine decarboxylase/phosphopantothenate--cysteine ligase
VPLATPYAVRRVDVRSVVGMRVALGEELGPDLGGADALVMAAAVADYVPRETLASKLKKSTDALSLDLVRAPDLIAEIGARRQDGRLPVLVGFALETGTDAEVVASARQKLVAKNLDLVVANEAKDGFGGADNRATLVAKGDTTPFDTMSKLALADEILNRVRDLYAERSPVTC